MGEEQLLELANQFLDTPKGLNILGEKIDIAGLKDELSNLSTKYNIDLSTKNSLNQFKNIDIVFHCASMTNAAGSFKRKNI